MRVQIANKTMFNNALSSLFPQLLLSEVNGFTIDSRLVESGDVYLPIKGENVDIDTGQKGARACGLNLLGQLKIACDGELDKVKRVVKLGGFVNATPDFIHPPTIMNGASDLMVEIFGDAGRHARFAVATASLPQGAAVEVDGIFEV